MTTEKPEVTQARLKELFVYKEGALWNKVTRNNHVKAGTPAGHKSDRGYINIRVDQRMYRAHRLIFLFHHGWLPKLIDHIDCDRTNNRIENLRACTKSENGMNRAKSTSSTGFRNVYRNGEKFYVSLRKQGKTVHIGIFSSVKDAAVAAARARAEHYGEFA